MRRWLSYRQHYLVVSKALETDLAQTEYNDVVFKDCAEEDIPGIAAQLHEHYGSDAEATLRRKIADGEHAVIGLSTAKPGELVYISWVTKHDELVEAFRGGPLQENEWCNRRILVPPRFRRQGFGIRGLAAAEAVARQLGCRELWAVIEIDNLASHNMHEKLGHTVKGSLWVAMRFGKTSVRVEAARSTSLPQEGVVSGSGT